MKVSFDELLDIASQGDVHINNNRWNHDRSSTFLEQNDMPFSPTYGLSPPKKRLPKVLVILGGLLQNCLARVSRHLARGCESVPSGNFGVVIKLVLLLASWVGK